jgi:hypothetical protein
MVIPYDTRKGAMIESQLAMRRLDKEIHDRKKHWPGHLLRLPPEKKNSKLILYSESLGFWTFSIVRNST